MKEDESGARTMPAWVDPAARMGHTAKGTVYAAVGALALWGIGGAGESGGGRAAIRAIAGAPIGRALIAVLAVGLASLELPAASRRWVANISRVSMTARGIVLLTIGGSLVQAAAAGVPVAGSPSRTALLGACLFALALLEWTRARYPLPDA